MESIRPIVKTKGNLTAFVLGTIALFVLAFVSLHFLRPDIDPIGQMTDAYMSGPFSQVMILAELVFSLGQIALAWGLARELPASTGTRVGLILFAYWAFGGLIVAIFPVNPTAATPSWLNNLVQINAPLHVISLAVGAILLSRGFSQSPRWRAVARPALILGILMLLDFVATAISLALNLGLAGLGQRIMMVMAISWFVMVTLPLRSTTARSLVVR